MTRLIFSKTLTKCFGCSKLNWISIKSCEWECSNCDMMNKYEMLQSISVPAVHVCKFPDYCIICVSNRNGLLSLVKSRKKKALMDQDHVFCSTCLHNQKVVITLLASDHQNDTRYKRKILARHPLACEECELKAQQKIERIDAKFKRDMLYQRLKISKMLAHEDQSSRKIQLHNFLKPFPDHIFSLLSLLFNFLRLSMLLYHVLSLVYPSLLLHMKSYFGLVLTGCFLLLLFSFISRVLAFDRIITVKAFTTIIFQLYYTFIYSGPVLADSLNYYGYHVFFGFCLAMTLIEAASCFDQIWHGWNFWDSIKTSKEDNSGESYKLADNLTLY